MTLLARNSVSNDSILEKALRRKLCILSVKEFWKWFHSLPSEIQIYCEECLPLTVNEDKKMDQKFGVKMVRSPCIKVITVSGSMRPFYVEGTDFEPKVWPSDDFSLPATVSQCETVASKKTSSETSKKTIVHRNAGISSKKRWKHRLSKIKEKTKKNGRINICEACRGSYKNLNKHIKSEVHTKHAAKANQLFNTVDQIIASFPKFDEVIQAARERRHRQSQSSMKQHNLNLVDSSLSRGNSTFIDERDDVDNEYNDHIIYGCTSVSLIEDTATPDLSEGKLKRCFEHKVSGKHAVLRDCTNVGIDRTNVSGLSRTNVYSSNVKDNSLSQSLCDEISMKNETKDDVTAREGVVRKSKSNILEEQDSAQENKIKNRCGISVSENAFRTLYVSETTLPLTALRSNLSCHRNRNAPAPDSYSEIITSISVNHVCDDNQPLLSHNVKFEPVTDPQHEQNSLEIMNDKPVDYSSCSVVPQEYRTDGTYRRSFNADDYPRNNETDVDQSVLMVSSTPKEAAVCHGDPMPCWHAGNPDINFDNTCEQPYITASAFSRPNNQVLFHTNNAVALNVSQTDQTSVEFSPLSAASPSRQQLSNEVSCLLQRLSDSCDPNSQAFVRRTTASLPLNSCISNSETPLQALRSTASRNIVGEEQKIIRPSPSADMMNSMTYKEIEKGMLSPLSSPDFLGKRLLNSDKESQLPSEELNIDDSSFLGSPFAATNRSIRGRIYGTFSPRRRHSTRLFVRMGGRVSPDARSKREGTPEMECRFLFCPNCEAFHLKPDAPSSSKQVSSKKSEGLLTSSPVYEQITAHRPPLHGRMLGSPRRRLTLKIDTENTVALDDVGASEKEIDVSNDCRVESSTNQVCPTRKRSISQLDLGDEDTGTSSTVASNQSPDKVRVRKARTIRSTRSTRCGFVSSPLRGSAEDVPK